MPDPTFLRIPLNEWKRKAVHMGCFGFAFLLPYITPTQAVLGAIGAFCFNAFLLPRLMPSILRPDENGKSTGWLEVILYPAAVLAIILTLFSEKSNYRGVIVIWFVLAIFDGVMGIFHCVFKNSSSVPWNRRKSIWALPVGALFVTVIADVLLVYLLNVRSGIVEYHFVDAFKDMTSNMILFLFILLLSLVESIWFGIADNLFLPFITTAFACLWLRVDDLLDPPSYTGSPPNWWIILGVPAIFSLSALAIRKITRGGAILGFLIAVMLTLVRPSLFLFLLGFFILGVAATQFGYGRKRARGIAEDRGGARGAAEIFGSAGVTAWMTAMVLSAMSDSNLYKPFAVPSILLIIISPLIAKTMDTVSSEIGKAVGGKTISLMNFRLVPPGTAGAVSLAGTFWGLAAAALLAALIFPLHWGGFTQWGILIGIAVAANLFESYWGAWASPRGLDDGPHTNFLMTLFAAVLAWFVWGR
jgi:uncharacterized protein (TIGR00297 family)